MNLQSPITSLKGIGEKTAERFNAAGINTVEDVLGYYPRSYENFEQPAIGLEELADGRDAAVCGFITQPLALRYAGRFKITAGAVRLGDDQVRLVWFNMPYLRNNIRTGKRYVFRGRVKKNGRSITLQQPKVYDPAEYDALTKQLQPVYRLGRGLSANMLKKAVVQAVTVLEKEAQRDYLPAKYRERYSLADYAQAVRWIHFPDSMQHFKSGRERIAFDEFLLFILGIRRYKMLHAGEQKGYALRPSPMADALIGSLPFSLTEAQKKVWEQVRKDMCREEVMGRLVQGDVGSGKTIIAFLALVMAADNGGQSALMAPTEVLARQHYESFCRMMQNAAIPVKAVLLTGSMKASERKKTFEEIENGQAQVVIGTHALIQEKVTYRKLMLCVVDEQHRFGVRQREALSCKGVSPHILIMSATPIPRTLAVLLYGDMQVSVIDQMPAGRLPIRNCVVDPSYRNKAYAFITRQADMGHQTYVICPMIEESEEMDLANVESYAQSLRENLPERIRVGSLHGKMSAAEKNERMDAFVRGEIQVLVSTTVIEVGVNVPNATVMMIEDAQRFGLAQLHQLRGRVGRGSDQSYCIMIDTSGRKEADPRLDIMNRSNDGFEIARKDLELRGPGDLLGIRQSGEMGFTVADVYADASLMQYAAEVAGDILREDAQLSHPSNALLCEKLTRELSESPQNIYV